MSVFAPLTASADGSVVAVAHDGEESSLVRRVGAELEALGFGVVTVRLPMGELPHDGLVEAARGVGAGAAIRIVAKEGRISVWLADLEAGKVTLREVVVDEADPDDSTIALEAVELTRVGLMELVEPGKAESSSGEETPFRLEEEPASIPLETEEAHGLRVSLELGPSVVAAGFDSPPVVDVYLAVVLRPVPLLGVELVGFVPLTSSGVEAPSGSTDVHFGVVGGGMRLTFSSETGFLAGGIGAGFGALFFKTSGRANEGYDGREDLVATGAPYLRAGISLGLAKRLRIRLDALSGFAIGSTEIRMDGEEEARFGRPFLSGVLALEVFIW